MRDEHPVFVLEVRRQARTARLPLRARVWLFGAMGVAATLLTAWLIAEVGVEPFDLRTAFLAVFLVIGQGVPLLLLPIAAGAVLAEERTTGTLEILFETPLKTQEIVGDKALAVLYGQAPAAALLLPCLLTAAVAAGHVGVLAAVIVDTAATLGFALYAGLFASAVTKNAFLARLLGVGLAVGTAPVGFALLLLAISHPHPGVTVAILGVKSVLTAYAAWVCCDLAVGRLDDLRNVRD
jgi:ABC-type transport system involved in multi-copper enzyme maturation permease subunit